MNVAKSKRGAKWWQTVLMLPLVVLLLIVLVLLLPLYFIWAACLRAAIWCWWYAQGRDILLVYSDSPIWHDYVEENYLPRIRERAVVINWSQRKQWRLSLATFAFYHFGGAAEFNPLAVVFRPLRRTRVFRFWKPFHEKRHGNPQSLAELESEFFASIGE